MEKTHNEPLSPELIKAPSSPMASPIRGPPAAAAVAGPVEEIPESPRSPPTDAFDDQKFKDDKRREEAETDSDVDDAKAAAARDKAMSDAAKAQIDAAYAAEFGDPDNVINRIPASPMPELDLNGSVPIAPSAGAASAAAPPAAASESKSGGGGGGDSKRAAAPSRWPVYSIKQVAEALRLTDEWLKAPSFLFGTVPYIEDEEDRKEIEDQLTDWIESSIQAARDETPDSKQSAWDIFDSELYARLRDNDETSEALRDSLELLSEFIDAYMKMSCIELKCLSFDDLHSFFMDVVGVELALTPVAAKRDVRVAELDEDPNGRKAKCQKIERGQSASDPNATDADEVGDDERSQKDAAGDDE